MKSFLFYFIIFIGLVRWSLDLNAFDKSSSVSSVTRRQNWMIGSDSELGEKVIRLSWLFLANDIESVTSERSSSTDVGLGDVHTSIVVWYTRQVEMPP